MILSLTPAAVCQCFTLVAQCTSIADPNWIQVKNGTDSSAKQLIYGVAFTLHAPQNLTDTAPLGGVNGLGMWLLYTLAALCYGVVLLSSSSFIIDFLGVGLTHCRLVMSLHVCTALLCLVVLGVSGTCLYVVQQNVEKGRLGWEDGRPGGSPSAPAAKFHTSPGESFYIETVGFVFSILASVFSCYSALKPITPSSYLSVEPGPEEREPLIGRVDRDSVEWEEESNTE